MGIGDWRLGIGDCGLGIGLNDLFRISEFYSINSKILFYKHKININKKKNK